MWHYRKYTCFPSFLKSHKKTSVSSQCHRDRYRICLALLGTKSRSRKKQLASHICQKWGNMTFSSSKAIYLSCTYFWTEGAEISIFSSDSGQDGQQANFPKCCTVVLTQTRTWRLKRNWFTLNNVLSSLPHALYFSSTQCHPWPESELVFLSP